jgi:hypothetical protein
LRQIVAHELDVVFAHGATGGDIAARLALVAKAGNNAGHARLRQNVIQCNGHKVFCGVAKTLFPFLQLWFKGGNRFGAKRTAVFTMIARFKLGWFDRVVFVEQTRLRQWLKATNVMPCSFSRVLTREPGRTNWSSKACAQLCKTCGRYFHLAEVKVANVDVVALQVNERLLTRENGQFL